MKNVSKRLMFFGYLSRFLAPLALAVLVTIVSVNYVNRFVRSRNERVAETIVHQLSVDVGNYLEESKQICLTYTTNIKFFRRLADVLNTNSFSYAQLSDLRTLEANAEITQSIRPFISSIYFCPGSGAEGAFLVSGEGIAKPSAYADGDFIRSARSGKYDGLSFRTLKQGTKLETQFLSYVMRCIPTLSNRTEGTVVVNMDVKVMQTQLRQVVSERTDDLFLVTRDGKTVFSSVALEQVSPPASDERLIVQGTEYLEIATHEDKQGFRYCLLATHASLYASSERLIALNLATMALSMAVGVAVSLMATARRYRDFRRVGDYMKKLDELGSRALEGGACASRYEDLQNYIRLHLSEHELKERTLELDVLRHQLNPHLLMNTLQMLNWRIMREQGCHTELNVTLENLCKILSYSLYPADSLATLQEEIHYTDSYMALQNHRNPNAPSIQWRIPEDVLSLRVPRLIFQPIVENACKYAFPAEQADQQVWVECDRSSGILALTVADNGRGMDEETLARVRAELSRTPTGNSGLGLYNAHKRIQLLFGRGFGLSVTSSPGQGTRVQVCLPAIINEQEEPT